MSGARITPSHCSRFETAPGFLIRDSAAPQMAVSQDDEDHHAAFWCFYQWGAFFIQHCAEAGQSTPHPLTTRRLRDKYMRPLRTSYLSNSDANPFFFAYADATIFMLVLASALNLRLTLILTLTLTP